VKGQFGEIIARVRLFLADAGGRGGPTPSDKFGCLMVIDEKNFDVRIHLEQIGSISPGQTAKVLVSFLDWECARKYCSVGKKFFLRELKTVGDGVIEEIRFLGNSEPRAG
jgi:hypothetical protein